MDPAKLKQMVEEIIDGHELVDEAKVVEICNGMIEQVSANFQSLL